VNEQICFSPNFEGANLEKKIIKAGKRRSILNVFSETTLESFRMKAMMVNRSKNHPWKSRPWQKHMTVESI